MFKIIVAHDPNRIIGNGPDIPWHISEDFKHFKQTTLGHTIVYGSTTYKSIGHALPNRKNVVLNFSKDFDAPGCEVVTSIDEIIERYKNSEEVVFICGGASIYRQMLEHCDELIISEVKKEYVGNIYFPEYKDKFELFKEDPREEFVIKYYRKIK
ncbi:MAG: dihydrofolate reductase [Bacillales bacterium]|nr:dihydrofolate reductase [Bacillales bacterium]